ncbi:MAG: hypothetical protein ABJA81_08360 [Nocardioidaceae bacterium]
MSDRVFVHIGAPKTGTTYLQQVLKRNRKAMKQAGVLYPRIAGEAHHTVMWDLRRSWEHREFGQDIRGHWDDAVRRAAAWNGHSTVFSSELFVYADKATAARALSSFGDAEMHVIYTARDLVRQAPAVWQERIKNQHSLSYDRFLNDMMGRSKTTMAQGFWSAQDAPAALKRWSKGVDPAHIHVVTAPPPGSAPDVLWRRFASVLGLDGADYPTDVPAANTSMSVTSAELLRRFNVRHGKDLPHMRYRKIVRGGLFEVLDRVIDDTSKLALTADQRDFLVKKDQQIVKAIEKAGYDVVGDTADLIPAAGARQNGVPASEARPTDITEDQVVDGLLDVVLDLLKTKKRMSGVSDDELSEPDEG